MSARAYFDGRIRVFPGDCLKVLAGLPENSVDSVVCDPPYHLASIVKRFGAEGAAPAKTGETGAFARASRGFIGKAWDGGDIAFRPETWAAVLRVLKPGGYILGFSSSRTFGRMSVAMEDGGFITHPMIGWIFGSGFPKATRIRAEGYDGFRYGAQSLKPALEPIYMGQKPFSEANGTENVLRWGTGAVNVDGCRVAAAAGDYDHPGDLTQRPMAANAYAAAERGDLKVTQAPPNALGRWPANLVLSDDPDVIAAFPAAPGQQFATGPKYGAKRPRNTYGSFGERDEAVPRGDSGSAARFFYQAKADAEDRLGSRHPTVKPLDLMRWLVRLVTPPGGLVLDPFAGTGTTGEAAFREGMRAALIEMEQASLDDIARRMGLLLVSPAERKRAVAKLKEAGERRDGPLFDPAPMPAVAAE